MKKTDKQSAELIGRGKSTSDQPLFRPEAIAQQQTQWLGTVLLIPPLSHTFFVMFAVAAAVGVLSLLFFAHYSRTESVSGWLVPKQGLVQVYSPRAGVISQLHVEEGTEIRKGSALLNISTEVQTESVGATQEEVVRRLGQRLTSLTKDRNLSEKLYAQRIKGISDRLVARRKERERRIQELKVQRELVELTDSTSKRLALVRNGGVMSEQSWLGIEGDRLGQLMAMRVLERDLAAFDRERMLLQNELKALPFEREKELAVSDRRVDELGQELVEAESRRQIVVNSPQSGTVTSVQIKLSSSVTPTLPLLSIIPQGSDLEAQLFIPTRAIGFIRPGQQVLLRYRAFPFQKFGHYEGIIDSVSRSTLIPSEFSPRVRSVSNLKGLNEPVYSIKVKLAQQTATAYGKAIDLQPGLQLDANILIESRRLIEWVLDPLYTLTGSIRG